MTFTRKPQWQVIYEIASPDQDRAAAFAESIVATGKPELIATIAESAQRLFGRAYVVNMKTGQGNPVRIFDDLAVAGRQNI